MKYFILYLKGVVIGIANIIPGVSGGTMAFIMNIYEELTDAIGNFLKDKNKRIQKVIFLLVLGAGGLTGIIFFAKLFTYLLGTEIYKQHTYMFFIGLILGSIPFIIGIEKDMKINFRRIGLVVLAFVMIIVTSIFGGEGVVTIEPDVTSELFGVFKISGINIGYGLWLAICGFLAAGSMVLPGFSGSALLISLGEYRNILYFVDERLIVPVLLVAAGAVPGLVVFAKVINMALKRFPSETIFFILGLILASLYQIYLEVNEVFSFEISAIALSLISAVIGFCCAYFLSKIKK